MWGKFKVLVGRVHCLVCHADLHGVRFLLALANLALAVSFYAAKDTGLPQYKVLFEVLPMDCWALVFMCAWLGQFFITAYDSHNKVWAVWFAGVSMLLWMFVVASVWLSSPVKLVPVETSVAIGAAWVFIRSGSNANKKEFNHGRGSCVGRF